MPILIRHCKTKAGFEALPIDAKTGKWDQERRLDLRALGKALQAKGYDIVDAGPLLIVKAHGLSESTIYPTGRLIIKCDQEADAKATATKIYKDIGLE